MAGLVPWRAWSIRFTPISPELRPLRDVVLGFAFRANAYMVRFARRIVAPDAFSSARIKNGVHP